MTSLIDQLPPAGNSPENGEREIQFFPYKDETEMRSKGDTLKHTMSSI